MVFRKLAAGSTGAGEEGGGRGSLTTLTVSDDDMSGLASPGPQSWDSLLNWAPDFATFFGVFKDIAELPDMDSEVRPSPLGDREEEEYI